MTPQDLSEVKMIGACINGIMSALLNRDLLLADFPRRPELAGIGNDEFRPISLYIDFCDYLEARLGTYAFLRLGRKMAATVMATSFPPGLYSVEAAIAHLQVAHQEFCRPLIGAFELTERSPGALVVRYTAPYNCTLQEGLFYEVAIRYGAPSAVVRHAACRRKGAEACRFEVDY